MAPLHFKNYSKSFNRIVALLTLDEQLDQFIFYIIGVGFWSHLHQRLISLHSTNFHHKHSERVFCLEVELEELVDSPLSLVLLEQSELIENFGERQRTRDNLADSLFTRHHAQSVASYHTSLLLIVTLLVGVP